MSALKTPRCICRANSTRVHFKCRKENSSEKHRTARLLSVILAVVMIFGSISVGVTAAYAPYLDDALTDNYNTIDQVTLTEAQQASLLLDKVDRALADANIVIDVSVVGTLNLTSIDNALSSIYSVTGNILFSSATVGDLAVLKRIALTLPLCAAQQQVQPMWMCSTPS